MAATPQNRLSVDVEDRTFRSRAPKGQIGYAEGPTTQAGISAEVDITGATVTVEVAANRRIRITGKGQITNDATAGAALGRIREGATELGRWYRDDLVGGGTSSNEMSVILTPSAGTHTYKLTLQKNVGAGSVTYSAGSLNPGFILVEDIGAA